MCTSAHAAEGGKLGCGKQACQFAPTAMSAGTDSIHTPVCYDVTNLVDDPDGGSMSDPFPSVDARIKECLWQISVAVNLKFTYARLKNNRTLVFGKYKKISQTWMS